GFEKTADSRQKMLSLCKNGSGTFPAPLVKRPTDGHPGGSGKEARVARPWRLRHKLVLGLMLVIGSIALLVAGATFALSSYMDATKVTEHDLHGIRVITIFRDNVQKIASENYEKQPGEEERKFTLGMIKECWQNIQYYRQHRTT